MPNEVRKMNTYVIGDIHGGLRALQEVLGKVDPEPEDLLVFLGDYVDGWSEAAGTIDFLITLRQRQKCLFLRGNHDDLCMRWLQQGTSNPLWLQSGGAATQKSYTGIGQATRKAHIQFLESLKDYFRDRENRLYLHAGFTSLKGVQHEYFSKMSHARQPMYGMWIPGRLSVGLYRFLVWKASRFGRASLCICITPGNRVVIDGACNSDGRA